MKTWECTECGYLHEGHKPPKRCPDCDAPASAFEPLEELVDEEESDDWDDDWEDLDDEDWDDDFDDDFDLDWDE